MAVPCYSVIVTDRGAGVAIVAGAAVAITVAGCSLLVSTDGLASSADADAGATDAGGSDASVVDANVSDGATEAAVDAGDASDSSTGPFCASLTKKPKFCADFDMGTVHDYGSLFGSPTLDLSVSKSAPASLLAVVETSDTTRGCSVQTSFTDTPSSVAFSFDVRVDEYDSTHDVELVTVNFSSAGNVLCDVNVAVRSNMWTLGEYCEANGTANGVGSAHRSPAQLQLAKWTHVDVVAALAAGGALTLTIDGTKVVDATTEPGFATGKTGIVIGIPYLQTLATKRSKVHTDNVTYDYQ